MWTLSVAAHALALRVFCVCFLGSFFVRIFLDPVLPSGLGRGRNWLRIAAARKSPPVAGRRRRAHLSRRPPKGPGRALGFRRGRRREGTRKPPGRGAWWGSTDWTVRARSGSRIRECRRAVLCPRVHRGEGTQGRAWTAGLREGAGFPPREASPVLAQVVVGPRGALATATTVRRAEPTRRLLAETPGRARWQRGTRRRCLPPPPRDVTLLLPPTRGRNASVDSGVAGAVAWWAYVDCTQNLRPDGSTVA